jgi:dihydroorotate dehydrogenase
MIPGTRALHISRSCIFFQRQTSKSSSNPLRCHVRTPKSDLRAYTTAGPVQRPSRIRNILVASSVSLGIWLSYLYITDTRASVHRWVAVPLIRAIFEDPEDAHIGGLRLLKVLYRFGLHPRERGRPDDAGDLETKVFNHTLANPLGISSGLDKHGEIPTQLLALGPAVIEIGGVTPSRQSGLVPIGVLPTILKGPGGSALFLKNISS